MPQSTGEGAGETKKGPALLILSLASFLVPFMGSSVNLALPQIGAAFSMGVISQSWVATVYLVATAIFQIPLARLADLAGRRKIFVLGLALFGASTFLCGLAPSAAALILLRAVSGTGAAMIFGTSMAILALVFPPENRGRAIGINTAVVYFALASGPFLGGLLLHRAGWQGLFRIAGVSGAALALLSALALKGEWKEEAGDRFDLLGTAIYAAGLSGLILGFTKLPGAAGFALLAGGLVLLALFIPYALKKEEPVLDIRIFRGNRIFRLSCFSALINYSCTAAIAFMLSLYLQYVRGYAPGKAGLVLVVQAAVQCLVSLYAGRLSDRVNPSTLATLGMGIIVAGLAGLIFVGPDSPLPYIVALLSVLGLGFGLFASPNSNIIMGSVERKRYGQASAIMGTMRLAGQALSMGIATMAISLCVGDRAMTPEAHPLFMRGFRITFTVFALLSLAGTCASSFRVRKG